MVWSVEINVPRPQRRYGMHKLQRFLLYCMVLAAVTTASGLTAAREGAAGGEMVAGTGTVVFNNLEGGFWGIVSDDGKRYDPLNLDKAFQISGLKVRFEARLRTDVVGFHMWGAAVELIHIERSE